MSLVLPPQPHFRAGGGVGSVLLVKLVRGVQRAPCFRPKYAIFRTLL